MKTLPFSLRSARRRWAGFTLVEITLALGVASVCLIPLLGLLPVGLNDGRNASEQTAALNLGSAILTDLRAMLPTDSQSPRYGLPVPGALATSAPAPASLYFDAAGNTNAAPAAARYRVTLTWATLSTQTAAGSLRVCWPATATDASTATQAVEFPVVLNH